MCGVGRQEGERERGREEEKGGVGVFDRYFSGFRDDVLDFWLGFRVRIAWVASCRTTQDVGKCANRRKIIDKHLRLEMKSPQVLSLLTASTTYILFKSLSRG